MEEVESVRQTYCTCEKQIKITRWSCRGMEVAPDQSRLEPNREWEVLEKVGFK